MPPDDKKPRYGPLRRFTRARGRSLTALSIPYIMLGYPVAGYGIGWFIHHTFGGPEWVIYLIMMLALVEAFREVIRIATRIAVDDDSENNDS